MSHGTERRTWHGVDRTRLTWYPRIDYGKCTGCGLCLLTCGNDVFRWSDRGLPIVANPGNCVLGCTTCAKLCPEDAMTFPDDPKRFLRTIIIKEKIYPNVKKELMERLSKYPDHRVDSRTFKLINKPSPEFSKWHGIDRTAIRWGPMIDEDKCVGCGLCVVQCSERRNVFGYDETRRKSVVLYPYNCMVGCNNCQVACLWDAIKFPDFSELKKLARDLVDSGIVRRELEDRLSRNPNLLMELPDSLIVRMTKLVKIVDK